MRIRGGRIVEVAPRIASRSGEPELDARGGALLPGLHDHHLHLFAAAAAAASVRCGPPEVDSAAELARALRAAPAGADGWLRGVGYHESVAGTLDRRALDAWVGRRPLRLQHRSGGLWMLSSAAVERLGLDRGADAPGVERDAAGRATGRLFGLDGWLRERLGPGAPPSLGAIGRALARRGVTGVTDATPGNGPAELAALEAAVARGELPQSLHLLGGPGLPGPTLPGVTCGALKLRLEDAALPAPDALAESVRAAHARGRPVAMHCVTRAELVLAAVALAAAGARPGDRIEHAFVAPPDVVALLAGMPLTLVLQPGFLLERGDAHGRDVDPGDRPWLHRARSLARAGLALAAGSDAPFAGLDPWRAMAAAVARRTASGAPLGPAEALSPESALALYSAPLEAPHTGPRRVAPGAAADLCLLDRPWREARRDLAGVRVIATLRAGAALWLDARRVDGTLEGAAAARRPPAGEAPALPAASSSCNVAGGGDGEAQWHTR